MAVEEEDSGIACIAVEFFLLELIYADHAVYVPIVGLHLVILLIKTVLAYYLLTRKEEIGMWVVQILERHCLCPLPVN